MVASIADKGQANCLANLWEVLTMPEVIGLIGITIIALIIFLVYPIYTLFHNYYTWQFWTKHCDVWKTIGNYHLIYKTVYN